MSAEPTPFSLPPDDPRRSLIVANADSDDAPHLGVAGGCYTPLLTGENTAGRFCLIDMFVPPGGGPPHHRHDFEETFIVMEGEIEALFRGARRMAHAGDTIHIPANAPHQFRNISTAPARLLCICSPAGLDEFFQSVGVPLPTRTSVPPPLDPEQAAAMRAKMAALGPLYRTEMVPQP